uniref:Aminotransferase-like plant mobile domain-containing protein n=1 Tax=Mycena chlorophos TaxID=658473 RepID=A0ABQ0L0S5_MYCCL|nr:predicted protein [Mycena chlorophos]
MNAKDHRHLPEPAFAKPKTSQPGQLEMPDYSAEIVSDAGEAILKQMNDGTYTFKPRTLPWIYYDAYTPGDPTEFLFRSDPFVRAMRLVWLGEKSMLTGLNGCLPDLRTNARICNVWTVTPEMVGYVACQLRVMLTPYDWSSTRATTTKRKRNAASLADEFDYGAHFKFIVGLFSDELYADWAKQTLEFLQSAVFGDATDPNEDVDDAQADSDDEFAANRRSRLAALHAAASIAPASHSFLARFFLDLIQVDAPSAPVPPSSRCLRVADMDQSDFRHDSALVHPSFLDDHPELYPNHSLPHPCSLLQPALVPPAERLYNPCYDYDDHSVLFVTA